jgi:hypothetical protein
LFSEDGEKTPHFSGSFNGDLSTIEGVNVRFGCMLCGVRYFLYFTILTITYNVSGFYRYPLSDLSKDADHRRNEDGIATNRRSLIVISLDITLFSILGEDIHSL